MLEITGMTPQMQENMFQYAVKNLCSTDILTMLM
jgi:hypothetical protein